jgi:hypothetical protein
MCATVSWGAHESFMHPIFVLKNGCDTIAAAIVGDSYRGEIQLGDVPFRAKQS